MSTRQRTAQRDGTATPISRGVKKFFMMLFLYEKLPKLICTLPVRRHGVARLVVPVKRHVGNHRHNHRVDTE
jgi:hypothetical protein